MTVPDWPNSYGYNMFFLPLTMWVGGIFYEHTHRLVASGVGLLTAMLALWLFGVKARPFLRIGGLLLLFLSLPLALLWPDRYQDSLILAMVGAVAFGASGFWPRCPAWPGYLRWLGMLAFLAVVLQGILGGLRVTLFKDEIGILHATLAQLFFALMFLLAVITSGWWRRGIHSAGVQRDRLGLRYAFAGLTLLVLIQLILGATMRHQHAGLAIPDFPLAHGRWWPDTHPDAIIRFNLERAEGNAVQPIEAFHITLHMIHRIMAFLILGFAAALAWSTRRLLGKRAILHYGALVGFSLLLLQVSFGALTVWTNKSAVIATTHVAIGSLCLAAGTCFTLLAFRVLVRGCSRVVSPHSPRQKPKEWASDPLRHGPSP